MIFICTECRQQVMGSAVLSILVERGWRLIGDRWYVTLVNLVAPGELLCSACAHRRRHQAQGSGGL